MHGMSNLQTAIEALSQQFSRDMLELLKNASMSDIANLAAAHPHAPIGRVTSTRLPAPPPPRTPPKQNGAPAHSLVSLLKQRTQGMRAEELRLELDVDRPTVVKLITAALEEGLIKKKGEKRATTYYAK